MLAAQTTPEQIEKVEPFRPITRAIVDWLGLEDSNPVVGILKWVVEPVILVLVLLAIAVVVL